MNDHSEILSQIAAGNEAAMENFYRSYSGVVYQFAFRTLRNGADAAEIVNEVMMEVWRKADSFAGKSKLKTWLLGITHHKAVDALRRKIRHDADEWNPDIATEENTCSFQDLKTSTQNREHVDECVSQLKDGQRQVVYLTFFEELPYPEIAAILEIPVGTVKTRMLHAKQLLMRCLSMLRGREAT